jgi:ABC-2 type transport system permease protein
MKGMITVFWKELADDFTRWRFLILFGIAFGVAILAFYFAYQNIKLTVVDPRFVFLKYYTASDFGLPLFILLFAFLIPLIGMSLGFDAVNSERTSGTLSRILSQSIYRDAVINGKFFAGATTIAVMLVSVILVIAGAGLRMVGIPPSGEEALRLVSFLVVGVIYGAFWLTLAILFSILFKRVATSALASIALWIFFIFLFMLPLLVPLGNIGTVLMQVNPISLFWESGRVLMDPLARTLGQMVGSGSSSARHMLPSALPVGQSLVIVWPHIVSLIALTAICFAVSYTKFMREEIRSTTT